MKTESSREINTNVICFSITKEVAASKYEFSYAQLEGITFEYNKRPVEIKDDGVIFRDIIENEDGTFTDVEGTDTLHHSDSVIISISQGPQNRIVNTTTGLKATARGLLDADETGHTSRPGIFASGDVVSASTRSSAWTSEIAPQKPHRGSVRLFVVFCCRPGVSSPQGGA